MYFAEEANIHIADFRGFRMAERFGTSANVPQMMVLLNTATYLGKWLTF